MTVREVPFSELLSAIVDNRGKTCPTSDEGIPLIATNCIRNELLYPTYENVRFVSQDTYSTWFRGHPRPGDILFVNKATPGRVCLVPDPVDFCIAQDMVAIRADAAKVYPQYLFAALRSQLVQERIRTMHVGTLIPHFKKGDFDKLMIPVPDRAAQVFIGNSYYEFCARIDLNRRMSETLEAIVRALFKSWFVDYDPVRAKAQGRDPGLPKPLADLFPDSFENSELGEIPTGWETRPLGDLLLLDKGLSYKGQFLTDHGTPMVNLGCFLGRGRFAEKAIKRYSGEYKHRHVVRPLDLVLANTDITQQREVLGSPALVPPQGDLSELIFSHHVFAARFHEGKEFWKAFVYFMLLQDDFRARAAGFATGTTVLALPRDAVLNVRFPGAPAGLVMAFAEMAMPIFERGWKSAEESRTIGTLRDAMLPQLISGEIRTRTGNARATGHDQ